MDLLDINFPFVKAQSSTVAADRAQTASRANALELSSSFRDFLQQHIDQLNADQRNVDHQIMRYVSGESIEPHEIMIASQKAMLGIELTVQVRNKAVEAYQEIMRMQL